MSEFQREGIMIYLSIALMIFGLTGLILAALENYNAANAIAWVVGILLAVFCIVKKIREDDSLTTYCEDACSECGEKKVKFTVGLGQHGNVPAYTEISCPKCDGKG
jgi:hypothetical protein